MDAPTYTSRTALRAIPKIEECSVVVIDVLRAFTTTAIAFSRGAARVIVACSEPEAHRINRRLLPTTAVKLIGDSNGAPISGFDYPNSPSTLATLDLQGMTLVMVSTHGSRAVFDAVGAGATEVWCTGYSCASATARALHKTRRRVYVVSGWRSGSDPMYGDDDLAVAEYIEAYASGSGDLPTDCLERIKSSPSAAKFCDSTTGLKRADLEIACETKQYRFAMRVRVGDCGLEIRSQAM